MFEARRDIGKTVFLTRKEAEKVIEEAEKVLKEMEGKQLNECVFYGRISKDIELRYTANQMAIARFSIAVNRQYQNQDKKADFLNMTAFSKTAENIERFFRKGSRIVVRCHAQQEEYTNKDGNRVSTVGFIVDSFSFVDTMAEGGIATSRIPEPEENSDGFI